MDGILEKHHGLIASVTRLYALLIQMRYLSPADVSYPPHTSPPVSVPLLQTIGFDDEVIELIQVLPAIKPAVTWGWHMKAAQIVPRSIAVSYLDPSGGHVDEGLFDFIRSGGFDNQHYAEANATLLPPWMFRLTVAGNVPPGLDLIYNVQYRSITEWTQIATRSWQECPGRPAETVMDEIAGKLKTLEWVPYYDPTDDGYAEPASREIVDSPLIMENFRPLGFSGSPVPLPLDDHEAALAKTQEVIGSGGVDGIRERLNRWIALQKLYRDCGWGSGDDDDAFDGDEFEARRLDLITTAKTLDDDKTRTAAAGPSREAMAALMRDNPVMAQHIMQELHGDTSHLMSEAQCDAKEETEQRVRDFWKQRAGDQAV
ncbi:Uu.00g114000.m01.CDS01 [Anthostomella pinea]|uniref:Uu.00g114000.m01.CDS01 n=1 Tax=Anthostomella pinea TaxID=933095 RepID=A0AAI8YGL9_9PEZI|nr:Uu.00g114000.m01.CDS01 [Anthostomella pinea]